MLNTAHFVMKINKNDKTGVTRQKSEKVLHLQKYIYKSYKDGRCYISIYFSVAYFFIITLKCYHCMVTKDFQFVHIVAT